MTHEPDRTEREQYRVSVDQVSAALTETVLRAQVESAEDPRQGGSLGTVLRVDRAFAGVERWLLRLLVAGIPLAVGIYLIAAVDDRTWGAIAIAASPVALLLVVGVERLLSRLGRAFDAVTDPRIAEAGGRRLKQAIEAGQVRVLSGTIDAALTGDRLHATAGSRAVTIPSVRAAWMARSASHLVIAAHPPGRHPDFAAIVVLPADGVVAAAIGQISSNDA